MSKRTKIGNDNSPLTVTHDHLTDFESIEDVVQRKRKIIFDTDNYSPLINLIDLTREDGEEKGCFFVGQKFQQEGVDIYQVIGMTESFETKDGAFKGGALDPQKAWEKQIKPIVDRFPKDKKSQMFIMMFHTHINEGLFECFSDQDLRSLETIASQSGMDTLGLLATPNRNMIKGKNLQTCWQLSALQCKARLAGVKVSSKTGKTEPAYTYDYYRYPSICKTSSRNNIIELGTLKRLVGPDTILKPEDRDQNAEVQVIGFEPRSLEKVKGKKIGTVDERGNYHFTEPQIYKKKPSNEREDEER